MTSSSRIVEALKRALKARGLTYRALAVRLDLSESAVKHMFSTGNFSLRRLDEVCDVLELDIGDLIDLSDSQQQKIEQLSEEYELELMSDMRLLLVAYCLLNYWTVDEIVARYEITPEQALKYLRRLDRMKFIELQPGDRVRLLLANNFSWRKNGAIEKFFRSRVQNEFFSHHFQDDDSVRIVKNGMLTRKSVLQLIDKLQATGDLFDDTSRDERKLPVTERHGTTMVLAIRKWFFEGFRELER
ncbi:MAG: helix-turn-helix transcriptional regulator [Gammaproteobacteria bacterium]|nr:helix-turn-helix transcriptional regulator [Gammaproteobacteria bacterium]